MSDAIDELELIGEALQATIAAGTYQSAPIRCALASGRSVWAEVKPCAVVIAPPAFGFDESVEEGWTLVESEWPLMLYSARGREPDTMTELRFSMAVVAALAADPTLGGVASFAFPLASDVPTPMAPPEPAPPEMFRRTLRVRVNHNPE